MNLGLSKKLVQALILSFALAIYQVFLASMWENFVVDQGASLGVGEVAAGYFLVMLVALMASWWITRRMSIKE